MCWLKVLMVTFFLTLQISQITGQRQWVLPTTTAAEMWNPYTWYWPYAIAASEGYRDWFTNAQQITNQLYMQAYATNAFWWTGGGQGGGGVPGTVGGATGAAGGAAGQATGTAGQATGTAGQAAGQATGGATNNPTVNNPANTAPVPNMSQGGTGWG